MRETAACLEAKQSHDALLQRVKEMEGEMEREKEQVRERFGKLSVCLCFIDFLKVISLGEASSSRLPFPRR